MKNTRTFLSALLGLLLCAPVQAAQDKAKPDGILEGPGTGKLGKVAQIEVPAGFVLLDGNTTRAMLKQRGDPVSGEELGFLQHTNGEWAVYFKFEATGYIKDDDTNQLNAAELLDSYRKGTAEGNKQREAAGRAPIEIVGWDQEPKYDPVTHNLTWCLRATSEGQEFVNYNTRLLGRKGVMKVVLACDPKDLPTTLPEFQGLLAKHQFLTGESYAEYKPGDKVAKYGLGALVLGGAAVGAAKLGLLAPVILFLKKGWKLVVVVLVAVAAVAKNVLGKIFGRKDKL